MPLQLALFRSNCSPPLVRNRPKRPPPTRRPRQRRSDAFPPNPSAPRGAAGLRGAPLVPPSRSWRKRASMSSPARSTVSAASGGAVSAAEDVADSIDALYRKDEAVAELKSEAMEALQSEVRSLDDDSWMFAAPRSRINLVSRTGAYLPKQQGKLPELGQASKKTRNF
ncbi:hypothetical protein PAHAL_9G371300 [Panicum hallii]|uniref:Uncharacterized protein n=1 Tax=Panicum hallii TaxID=206008 RepID=A0A2S3INT4_9POAL|nr:uncharacterized protein LOC112876121 isoform X2 [Panicum hallii]PAN48251.1 hypothetical protein PAHAL_9G371300 [Panicum hallii]